MARTVCRKMWPEMLMPGRTIGHHAWLVVAEKGAIRGRSWICETIQARQPAAIAG